ncbi:MAG: endopeptidase La [Rhodothermales bacterium]
MMRLMIDDDSEQAIPLPTADEEKAMSSFELPDSLPILALRNTVLFPGVVLPITVGRDASLRLVKDAFGDDALIGVVAQKRSDVEDPEPDDLFSYGTAAAILKLIKMPDGSKSIVIQGKRRFKTTAYLQTEPYFRAQIEAIQEDPDTDEIELDARIRSLKELAIQIVNLSPNLPSEAALAIQNIDSPTFLIHFIASNLQIDVHEKQQLLETVSLVKRAELVMQHLNRELQVLQLSEEIRSKVKTDVDKQQREYLLRQQIKTIQEELGESEGGEAEVSELRDRARNKKLPDPVREVLNKELDKLSRTNPASPDYAVSRNYVDWILDLPWLDYSEDDLNIRRAEKILNEDHYGLEKVKKRILEYLAVLKLKGDMKAPILCFYGPPGVGKTSLGKSIARALGREFVRMSLGGVRDEAEIRGHRRTYVGALPGRIIKSMKRAGTSNPVIMLDEVDKLGSDFRGDPSSALLEVLDPEQNNTFNDHYLELDYDLSRTLFIATANYLERIPAPLRDRMELIEITGYTQQEKLAIAKGYLVPRQVEQNGLKAKQFTISDKAIAELIDGYTRESGVRQLEREIGGIARGVARKVAMGDIDKAAIDETDIKEYLGARKYYSEVAQRTEVPGVATGLAWTPVGGDILFIEASAARGTGRLILTGQLGDVMKESAQAAHSYVKAQAANLGIPYDAFRYWDVHVHIPAGSIPKDGPSAGVTLLSALVSIYTQRRIKHSVAMTGEITLRGLVLPVGGIKEKVLAAKRAGIRKVLLPEKNRKDIEEIEPVVLKGLKIVYVKRVEDVLNEVLQKTPMTRADKFYAVPEKERQNPTPQTTNGHGTVVQEHPEVA